MRTLDEIKKTFHETVKDFGLKDWNLKQWMTERSLYTIIFGALLVLLLYVTLDAFEVIPEFPEFRRTRVTEQPESLTWVGMKLVPLSRGIRKEFNIPAKVKGMFVVNEGLGDAQRRGVMTGDVIVSINGQKFKDMPTFIAVANQSRYFDGILLDVFRNGKNVYVSIPFTYEYGPLMGPAQGRWQLGAPLFQQLLPYGRPQLMPRFSQAAKEQQ